MISSKPSGVVSLYDLMQRYRMDYFALAAMSCQMAAKEFLYMDKLRIESVQEEFVQCLCSMVKLLSVCMKNADGDPSLIAQIDSYAGILDPASSERRPAVLHGSLAQIIQGVDEVLKSRMFAFIPSEQAKYFINLEQFGDSVSMFPDAIGDMVETSTCYAAGRATACIFHAMRVAEHGLRHIAEQLGVETSANGKPCPVEYQTWEQVLIKIESKRSELRQESKSADHEARTREYAGLADHMAHLKDLWRNPTMHSRGLYSMPEALGVMGRVAELMNLISGSVYAPPVSNDFRLAMQAVLTMTNALASGQ